MTQQYFHIFILFVLTITSCKTSEQSSQIRNANSSFSNVKHNLFDKGFTIRTKPNTKKTDEYLIITEDANGHEIAKGSMPISGFELDRAETPTGEVIFSWPKDSEIINRNYNRVGELMKEYSNLVGTLLFREPVGPGEVAWQGLRGEKMIKIYKVVQEAREKAEKGTPFDANKVANAWCSAAIEEYISILVPQGSTYRQYGNCGEGGIVAACLAKRAAFQAQEIRICESANDHVFAMIHRGKENNTDYRWCLLDRWDLIGNFQCEVDIDDISNQVLFRNRPIENIKDIRMEKWYQKVACVTLDKYLFDAKEFYAKLAQLRREK